MAVRPRPAAVDAARWSDRRRILCVRTDGIGDILMTAPAIRALKAAGPPDRTITVLGSAQAVEAARLLPDVDDAVTIRPPWSGVAGADDPSAERATIDALRERAFDAAVIFTVHTQSALPAATWCRLAGIPRRLAHSRENPYALLTDWVPDPEPDAPIRHEVVRQLDLVAHVGAPPVGPVRHAPSTEDMGRALAAVRAVGIEPREPWLALHPGASAPSRRYPPERFAAAADALRDDGWQVLVTGGPDDEAVGAVARAARSHVRVAPAVELRTLAAILSLAHVVVANNTGPAHVAALVGTPVVDLYALTNLQHAPWGVPHRVLFHDVPCRNCLRSVCPEGHHLCLRGVDPGAVVSAVRELAGDPIPTERRTPALVTT